MGMHKSEMEWIRMYAKLLENASFVIELGTSKDDCVKLNRSLPKTDNRYFIIIN